MKKVLFFALALCLVASTAYADAAGRIGVGATMDKDVSLFYGLTNGSIISGGLSFASTDLGEESATEFGIGAAFEYPLLVGENAQFNLNLGVDFNSYDVRLMDEDGMYDGAQDADEDNSGTLITPRLGFKVRYWFSNSFSLAAGHGLEIKLNSPPGEGAEGSTDFGTYTSNFTDMEFTYWFDKK